MKCFIAHVHLFDRDVSCGRAHVCVHVCLSGGNRSLCRSESVGCGRSVATADPPPQSDLQPAQGGLPVSPLFSSTDEHGRSQTNASRNWSVTGNGGREGERTHLMRSMIHRHPRGHTLEWGNTTHVLTGLSHNSLGLPRLRGTPKERSPGNHHYMLLNTAHIGWLLIFKTGEKELLGEKKRRKQQLTHFCMQPEVIPRFPTFALQSRSTWMK